MRETAPTEAPTADEIDRDAAERYVLTALETSTDPYTDAVITAMHDARLAGFAAGLEERADEAHAAGYAEGLADGIEKGRAAAVAVFEELFAGGPDTSCRTVWDESQAVPELGIGPLECVSVPMTDLRAAFDEAKA